MIYITDPDASKIVEVLNLDPSGVRLTQAEVNYVHYLVSNLKATGMWQNSLAIYGFVGGTAYKHQWNWKDMRNLDVAFRLTPIISGIGTVNHSSMGIRGFAQDVNNFGSFRTYLTPTTTLTDGNQHFSYYVTIDNANTDVSIGQLIDANNSFQGFSRQNSTRVMALKTTSGQTNLKTFSSLSITKGNHLATINGSSLDYFFKSVKEVPLTITTIGVDGSERELWIAGRNETGTNGVGSSKTYGFASIGSGLTDTIATTSSHHITVAQSILNRA